MNNRFDTFTPRARRVLSLAQEEAQRLNHNYIGTEHLLLGLIREADSIAGKVLAELGVDLNRVRAGVEHIIGRGDRIVLGEIRLTPRAKKVIELAVDESRHLNHPYVGTEHLLLGLIREGEGIAAGVLESLGVNLEVARQATMRTLDAPGGTSERRETGPIPSSATVMGTHMHAMHGEPIGPLPASPDTFDMFTARALKVLSLAQEEAQRLNHNYIGTEHLLLGLIRENDGVAAKVLANLGVSLPEVRQKLEEIIGRGDRIVFGDIGLTPRAKKVIELAVDEAQRLNHHYIGTEHLLLGLVREGEGIAADVLVRLGVSLAQVRTQTIQILGPFSSFHAAESPTQASPPGGTFTFALRPNATVSLGGIDEGAQHVLRLAFAEAQQSQQDAISDVHILLGLVLEGRSVAALALEEHGATIFAVRRALDSIKDADYVLPGEVGLALRTQEILRRARTESTRHGASLVTPVHLLLCLLTASKGAAVAALQQLGIDPGALYAEVSQRMHDDGQTDQPSE
ncbi:MAG: Clp protease N-terminal domain-containing protein [Ktedonobacterales bacterium]